MNNALPHQKKFPLNQGSCAMQEKWITPEGLLVTAIVVSLVLLALLEQLVLPYFRH